MDLDAMMDTAPTAKWMGLCRRKLLAASKGRKPKIPGFWLNDRVVRFHPRTIIAKLAADAGVSPEVIAASFQISGPVKVST